eukprot:3623514-Pyramimonas_sp.AAC.1
MWSNTAQLRQRRSPDKLECPICCVASATGAPEALPIPGPPDLDRLPLEFDTDNGRPPGAAAR